VARERAKSVKCSPGCYDRQGNRGGRGLSAPKAEGGPNQEWEAEIFKGIVAYYKVQAITKDDPGPGKQAPKQGKRFHNLFPRPLLARIFDPEQQEGRDDDGSDHVAKPPGRPD